MNELFEKIHATGILPVIALDDAAQAVPLARALAAGGIPAAEVTFRTAAGEEAIRRIAQEVPEVLVGAGTVLTCEQADRAVNAGARFIVSPGTNAKVVYHCQELGVQPIPGVVTPTEIETAMELELDTLKFFPAEPSGGLAMIKALAAPYTQIKFIPTGGISAANVGEYLKYPKILACGGSWMVKKDLVNAGKFDEITALAVEAAAIVRSVREGK
ncbi:MAG: bifunctional 4-hydroxy-2-oxoglutarate aldolase/2-dehydro-3-deoxy-phosphogluconate aldolase [Oscillospiraceae bacterium]|nr:bifunctional 4-hydroxy-2-oxoglutarate aldolase/2-dehydro-3-deoxy-phosphogluconate aldolase [Oscillospiraceae bacterium]